MKYILWHYHVGYLLHFKESSIKLRRKKNSYHFSYIFPQKFNFYCAKTGNEFKVLQDQYFSRWFRLLSALLVCNTFFWSHSILGQHWFSVTRSVLLNQDYKSKYHVLLSYWVPLILTASPCIAMIEDWVITSYWRKSLSLSHTHTHTLYTHIPCSILMSSVNVFNVGHHPDLHLVGWNNVKIEIWTHAVGKDFNLLQSLALLFVYTI